MKLPKGSKIIDLDLGIKEFLHIITSGISDQGIKLKPFKVAWFDLVVYEQLFGLMFTKSEPFGNTEINWYLDYKFGNDGKEFQLSPQTEMSALEIIRPRIKIRTQMIVIPKWKNNYGLLAHECIHIAHFIFQHLGVKSSLTNDEPLTYLVQAIMNKCLKVLK